MSGIANIEIRGDSGIQVSSLKYDSRRVCEGDLFAAVKGENFDGIDFIPEALEKGARSCLVPAGTRTEEGPVWILSPNVRQTLALASRNYFNDPSAKLKVVGITGTNGKTTSSYLVHGILESAGLNSGLIGTVQYLLGGEIISAARTTPESPDLFSMLDAMVKNGCKTCIVEVSSHALALDRVTGVNFEAAVFTNLTRDHLDFHEDMEDYFSTKAALFEKAELKYRVINRDDPFGSRLIEKLNGEIMTYGMTNADIMPEGPVRIDERGCRCTLNSPWGRVSINTALTGKFNLYNIMAAVAACGILGVGASAIASGLSQVDRIPGRFEKVNRGQAFTAVVDYAHTPDALENVLENARAVSRGRVITVFGCGGDRDKTKRPLMGMVAGRLSDLVFVTSDNPRSEDPETILDDIMEGLGDPVAAVQRVSDRRKAIEMAVQEARQGDMVVVAGKGHENYQIMGDKVLPFSDADELARAILKMSGEEL
jgi:UDP-N-acetylmuramoyl-L-alanyl-D-glutamate--2,6-diaminopimelate ligase